MADDRKRQQAWRGGGVKPAAEPGPRKRGVGKRFAVLALILGIVGIVVGLLVYLRPTPRPIALGIAVTQYTNHSYAPNAFAQQDSEAIRAKFEGDSAQAFQGQEKQGLLDQVIALAERTGQSADKGRPVVIHLSAHAVSRGGKVYLLPGRAEPDNPTTWLALEEILAALARGKSPRLLLLDLSHPIADAHAGILADNVAATLHDELSAADKAGKLPFFVLTSCKAGEISNTSLEFQHSLFGFFAEQALLGHADGWVGDEEPDRKVSARELAEYVRVEVAHWSAGQRLSPQTPQLYGQGKDFVLISPKQPFEPMKLPDPPPDYPKWLDEGWALRDKWHDAAAWRLTPRTFRELELLLGQSEQRWLAGDKEESVKNEFDGKLADLKKQREELALKRQAPRSIAAARRAGIENDKAVGTALRPLLERILAKTPLKPEDFKPLAEKPPDVPPFAGAAYHTLAAALELPDPTPEQLKGFDDLLKNFSPAPRFIELAALRFLVDLDPKVQERWNDKALAGVRRLVLAAAKASEEAVAIDPRSWPWLKADLIAADKDHRDGLVLLATGGEDARLQGRDKLRAAVVSFEQIAANAKVLEAGFLRLEETRALLPALVAPLGKRAADSNDERLWSTIVVNAGKLQQLLTPPTSAGKTPLDEVTSLTNQLQYDLGRLREPYQPSEADRMIRRAGKENGPTADELRRLLDSPLWPAATRKQIYNSARDLGQTSAAETMSHAANLPARSAMPAERGKRPDAPAWRARLAIDLLRLDGISDVKPMEELLAKSERSGDWQELGEALRRAWAVTLPAKFRDLGDLAAKERAAIALHPLDVSALPEGPGKPPVEPAAELRRRDLLDFWRWLARERYQKLAEELAKFPNRADLAAYARAMDEMRQEFLTRTP
jgi:hypothetical protein